MDHATGWARDNALDLVGHWHTHPTGSGVPSPQDIQAWASGALYPNKTFIGIIAVRGGELGWMAPRLHGWVTRRKPGWIGCELLRLFEE